jgi:hypothetical protein
MEENEFPADMRRFLLASVPSIPHLEALMLLRGTAPKRWSADCLAPRLYVQREEAAAALADLAHSGLLRNDGLTFSYGATSGELASLIDRLAELYATHLVQVTLLIHSTRR